MFNKEDKERAVKQKKMTTDYGLVILLKLVVSWHILQSRLWLMAKRLNEEVALGLTRRTRREKKYYLPSLS